MVAGIASPVLAALVGAGLWVSWIAGPTNALAVVPLSLVAWPALLLLALRSSTMTARPLLWLGDRSYAIYLLHMPMIDFVAFGAGGLTADRQTILVAQFGLAACTLAAADLTYRRFELPARKWVRDIWRPRTASAASPT
ncbi:MAG: acyltransferase [Sphingomonadales bacterium]|nr:acyltransferase [Sphingomonadales bacterium]